MNIKQRIESHAVIILIVCGAVVASATWFVAKELLVQPRDYEINQLKEELRTSGLRTFEGNDEQLSQIEQSVTDLENKLQEKEKEKEKEIHELTHELDQVRKAFDASQLEKLKYEEALKQREELEAKLQSNINKQAKEISSLSERLNTLQSSQKTNIQSETVKNKAVGTTEDSKNSKHVDNLIITLEKIIVSKNKIMVNLAIFNKSDKELKLARSRGPKPTLMDNQGNDFKYVEGINYVVHCSKAYLDKWLTLSPKSNTYVSLYFSPSNKNLELHDFGTSYAFSLSYKLCDFKAQLTSGYSVSFTEFAGQLPP